MDTVQQNTFESILAQHDERAWCEALDFLLPLIHPVDQDATRVWFAFGLCTFTGSSKSLRTSTRRRRSWK
ncbi:MAG: hypothetical protein O7G29_05270 [Acidobacteria bacterium]|nr:hypothetical protein [Acidobacteriota bacterium]